MVSVHDVAAYILRASGPMSTMKLQKLVYYTQAWSLVWDDAPLFGEEIQAWANGPVVYDLFEAHRGRYTVGPDWPRGNPEALTPTQRETVDAILVDYGNLTARQLSHLTHSEAPWRDARTGLGPTDRSSQPISLDSLVDYYGALDAADDVTPVDELDWSGWERPQGI